MKKGNKHTYLIIATIVLIILLIIKGENLTNTESIYGVTHEFIPVTMKNVKHFRDCSHYHAYKYSDGGIAIKNKVDFRIIGKRKDDFCKIKIVNTSKILFIIPDIPLRNVQTCYVPMEKMKRLADLYTQAGNGQYIVREYDRLSGHKGTTLASTALGKIWSQIDYNYCETIYPFDVERNYYPRPESDLYEEPPRAFLSK